jgi:hypothetical protein
VVDRCVVDHEFGEWYALVGEDGLPVRGTAAADRKIDA